MYYFAYGSNMNIKNLEKYLKNCNALITGIGELKNYSFRYNRQNNSFPTKKSRANIVKRKGSTVYGLIFDIDDIVLNMLNIKEGVEEKIYKKINVIVNSGGEKFKCLSYTMVNPGDIIEPPVKYKKLIVEAGLLFNFPKKYMKKLRKID